MQGEGVGDDPGVEAGLVVLGAELGRGLGERGPVAQVAVGEVVVDLEQQLGLRTVVDGMEPRDQLTDLRRGQRLEAPSTSDTAGPAAERVSSGSGDDPGDLADLLSNRDWNFLVQVTTLVVVAMVVLLVFTDGPVTALLVSCLLLVPPAVLNYLFLRDDSTRLAEPPPSPPD